jgi:hypothetical protein
VLNQHSPVRKQGLQPFPIQKAYPPKFRIIFRRPIQTMPERKPGHKTFIATAGQPVNERREQMGFKRETAVGGLDKIVAPNPPNLPGHAQLGHFIAHMLNH